MKKNKYLTFVALAAAALATSCASDDLAGQKQSQTGSQTVTLSASVNDDTNATTRVGMTKDDTNAKFYWHKADAISVLTVDGSNYSNAKFTTTAENGATTATFTGDVTGKVGKYALYPYSDSHKFTSETALTYNLPATYSYEKVESNIFSKDNSYPSNSTNIPMLGTITDGSIAFKHIGGLAVIRIDKMPTTSGTLTVTADQQLSGDFTVSDLTSTPTIATTTASSGNNTVTFTFGGAKEGEAGVFYLPLATGSYTNVKIVLNSGKVNQTINYGNLTVQRAVVTAIPVVANRIIDGHVFVDLGLSVLWAETNIGANSATECGGYYAWGEVTPKTDYSWSTYKWTENGGDSFTKYTKDGKTVLDAEDDAAYANWGTSCRMPTNEEFEELISKCEWDETYVDGVRGWKVTSKTNNNSIFLPITGYYYDNSLEEPYSVGKYWSSSLYTDYLKPTNAAILDFDERRLNNQSSHSKRFIGCAVRPVAAKQ